MTEETDFAEEVDEGLRPIERLDLPKSVRIGFADYNIIKCSDKNSFVKSGGLMGMIENTDQEIRIASDMPVQNEAVTLLHEIIHGIFFLYGDGQQGRTWEQEDYVGAASNGLAQLFQQNPDFVIYLLHSLGVDGFMAYEEVNEPEKPSVH